MPSSTQRETRPPSELQVQKELMGQRLDKVERGEVHEEGSQTGVGRSMGRMLAPSPQVQ
jgi:hypothetical protein